MWKNILSFELRYQVRQPWFWASALVLFGLALALASSDIGAALGDAPGTTLRNAPLLTVRLMPVVSLISLFMITAFIANAALRDFEHNSHMLFFTKPISKLDYLAGRFLGALTVSGSLLILAVGGLMAAHLAPWQPAPRLGPFSLGAHVFGLLVIILPNLVIMGSIFFALASWSRRLSWTYLGVVFFIGMQDAIEILAQGLDRKALGGLLEPSGIVALESMSRYWTLAEQSTRLPELTGVLLANRLLWMTLALGLLAASYGRFQWAGHQQRPARRGKAWWRRLSPRLAISETASAETAASSVNRNRISATAIAKLSSPRTGDLHLRHRLRQLLSQTRLEVSEVAFSTPFLTLLAFGLMFITSFALVAGSHEGMPSYPLTHLMLRGIQLGVRLTLVLILVFYAGEMIFNPRTSKVSQVFDALPVPNWVFLGAKLLSLVLITGFFLLAALATTLLVQLGKGYVPQDFALYARGLAIIALPLLLIIPLAVFLQVLSNQKFIGLLLTITVLILRFALPRLGFEDNLYLVTASPPITYSGLNGYGHQLEPFLWLNIYWGFGAVILLAATLLLWPRGTKMPLRERLRVARRRCSQPVMAAVVLASLGMSASGAWIFHNTHQRGGTFGQDEIRQRSADYERAYEPYRHLPLPRITSVFAEVDIFPHQRRVEVRGRYRLVNDGTEPIQALPFTMTPRWVEGVLPVYGGVTLTGVTLSGAEVPPHRWLVDDPRLGFYVAELVEPLAPGQAIDFGFRVTVDHSAFANRRHNNLVVANGTFFTGREVFPSLGYARGNELRDPSERQKRGLPPPSSAAPRGDATARQRNYMEADWIELEAIVSTSGEQQAITAGDLLRQWTQEDRNYFHYKTSAPVTNLIPFLSGAYQVARRQWQGIDLEIYFKPSHGVNIERFLDVTEASLDDLSTRLGPYPHRQLRIVEIPSYHGKTAFSLAQTIAFSEAWCFNADLDRTQLDWLTAVLAHEVSHQWWNHQMVPADVEGATFLGESLAQHSAMKVLQRLHGAEMVRDFLSFDRDQYLRGRGEEKHRELPLATVDNQAYVHYSKGSLAFAAFEDLAGEEALSEGLRAFLEETAFAGPPYATSEDLLRHLRRTTPAEGAHWIEDLFETITLFDNRIVDASTRRQRDGRYEVALEVATIKLRDDGLGKTSEIAIDDWIDIAIFGPADGTTGEEVVLALERHHVRSPTWRFTLEVGSRPERLIVDPYHKLIERDTADNSRQLTVLSEP